MPPQRLLVSLSRRRTLRFEAGECPRTAWWRVVPERTRNHGSARMSNTPRRAFVSARQVRRTSGQSARAGKRRFKASAGMPHRPKSTVRKEAIHTLCWNRCDLLFRRPQEGKYAKIHHVRNAAHSCGTSLAARLSSGAAASICRVFDFGCAPVAVPGLFRNVCKGTAGHAGAR